MVASAVLAARCRFSRGLLKTEAKCFPAVNLSVAFLPAIHQHGFLSGHLQINPEVSNGGISANPSGELPEAISVGNDIHGGPIESGFPLHFHLLIDCRDKR